MEEGDLIQENIPQKRDLQKILLYIVCFLLLLFSLKSCFDTSKLEGQAIELKKKIELTEKQVSLNKKEYKVLKDSLKEVSKKRNDTIQKLREENNKQKDVIASLRDKNKKQKEDLDKWNYSTYTNFLKDYYKTQNVVETPQGVELQKDVPKQVAITIFDKEKFEGESKAKDTIIENKDKEIIQEQEKTKEALLERDKADSIIVDMTKLDGEKNTLLENQDKNIKFLGIQNKFLKVATPVAFIAGTVLGILIVK